MNTLIPSREIQRVPAALLSRDPDNYRRRYPAEPMEELAESIYEEGVIQNLECGPDGRVHLGNRRIIATVERVIPRLEAEIAKLAEFEGQAAWSELAGVEDPEGRLAMLRARLEDRRLLPVRVLDAEEVKDAKIRQVVENLQREGVSALDEAEGYARLLEERDASGGLRWTAESIAKRIGKGRTAQYVSNRLKLLRAPESVLAALDEGLIPIRVAEMVGRVPNEKARAEFARRVLKPQYSDKPLNERETADLLREEFMTSLKKADFDQEDATLIAEAGTCSTCQFRTGNDPSLADELQKPLTAKGMVGAKGQTTGIAPDICTNTACFRAKGEAAWLRIARAAEAEAEGFDVLPPEEAAKIFTRPEGKLVYNSPWVDLDSVPAEDFLADYKGKGKPKWRTILKDSGLRITKARNLITGRIVDLARLSAVKEAVRRMLEEVKAAKGSAESGKVKQAELFAGLENRVNRDGEAKLAAARARRDAKIAQRAAIAAADAITDALTPENPPAEIPRAVMIETLRTILDDSADACAFAGLWLDLERPFAGASGRDYLKPFMEHVEARDPAYTERELFALIVFASMAKDLKWQGVKGSAPKAYAKLLGVDLAAVEKKARKEFNAEEKERKARGKGKGARVTGQEEEPESGGEEGDDDDPGELARVSLLGPDNPKAGENERLLIVLEIAIQTSDLEAVDLDFVQARKPDGRIDFVHTEQLWTELVARGVIDDEGKVLDIPNWRKDAVGNRRADAFYRAQAAAGAVVSIAAVEERFGLKANALATYRKNQNRNGKGGAEG